MATFISNSAAETEKAGRQFAADAGSGSIFALRGDLGAGKTQFTKGLAAGLGSGAAVTSPTFTILHEYIGGRWPIYHFDFFRVTDPEALIRMGLDDYLFGEGVSVIEWPERFPALVPAQARWVDFTIMSDNSRVIEIR